MWVAVFRLELSIPGARSRKDRRQVVRSLKERLAGRFNVMCAEVDDQESWVRASLGVTSCANEKALLKDLEGKLVRYVANDRGAMLGNVESEVFRFEAGVIEWPLTSSENQYQGPG
jgi:uncharacterized protein YlxP (DUF503 family)